MIISFAVALTQSFSLDCDCRGVKLSLQLQLSSISNLFNHAAAAVLFAEVITLHSSSEG